MEVTRVVMAAIRCTATRVIPSIRWFARPAAQVPSSCPFALSFYNCYFHEGVTCDDCPGRKSIIGNRYKSKISSDDDLCSKCFKKQTRDPPESFIKVARASDSRPCHIDSDSCGASPIQEGEISNYTHPALRKPQVQATRKRKQQLHLRWWNTRNAKQSSRGTSLFISP